MGGLPLTIVAYTAVALIAAWWFLRTQSGAVNPRLHVVVSVIFGLLWPVSFPWRAFVHTTARVIANYRLRQRRIEEFEDEQIIS